MIFTHGSNINFHQSACEMSVNDLNQLFHTYCQKSDLLVGTIHMDKEEIRQFGSVQNMKLDENNRQFVCDYQLIQSTETDQMVWSFDDWLLSHEARFDVIDDQLGEMTVSVLYITFLDSETDQEITTFYVDPTQGHQPLAYVAAFWERVSEIGRDTDFSITGCHANDFAKQLKNRQ